MRDQVTNLNRILSSSIRREILELIRENGELSYVAIRQALGQMNTGQLNYHLKSLGDLVSKDTLTGKYKLSEAGNNAMSIFQNKEQSSIYMRSGAPLMGKSELFGIIVPLIILSVYTYYVFFYLGIVKISTVVANLILWAVVLIFIWRGTFFHIQGEKYIRASGKGGN